MIPFVCCLIFSCFYKFQSISQTEICTVLLLKFKRYANILANDFVWAFNHRAFLPCRQALITFIIVKFTTFNFSCRSLMNSFKYRTTGKIFYIFRSYRNVLKSNLSIFVREHEYIKLFLALLGSIGHGSIYLFIIMTWSRSRTVCS